MTSSGELHFVATAGNILVKLRQRLLTWRLLHYSAKQQAQKGMK